MGWGLHIMEKIEANATERGRGPAPEPHCSPFPSHLLCQQRHRKGNGPKQHAPAERKTGNESEQTAEHEFPGHGDGRKGGQNSAGKKVVTKEDRKLITPDPVFGLDRRKKQEVKKEQHD